MNWPWSELGLAGPSGLPEIRRAYAERLKSTHPEDDPEGFQRLHDAYQLACRIARKRTQKPLPSMEDEPRKKPVKPETPPEEEKQPEDEKEKVPKDWDFDKLLHGGKKGASSQEQPEDEKRKVPEDWDFDKLLHGGKKGASSQEQPEDGEKEDWEDWDFDDLLRGVKGRASRRESKVKLEEWDYDELLQGAKKQKAAKQQPEDKVKGKSKDRDSGKVLQDEAPEEEPETQEAAPVEGEGREKPLRNASEEKPVKAQPAEKEPEKPEDEDQDERLRGTEKESASKKQPVEKGSEKPENEDQDERLRGTEKEKPVKVQPEEAEAEKTEEADSGKRFQGRAGKRAAKEQPEEKGRAPSADWDFERLFAEGEEEAQAAQRRKIEELREKNRARLAAQEKEQRRRAEDDEESWAAVMAAAHALELLLSNDAPVSQWRAFLHSQVFWNVKFNLDFIFALEDFLEQNPELPKPIRRAFFTAYGFERSIPAECRRLARLLNLGRKDRRRLRWSNSPFRKQLQRMPARQRFATIFSMVFLGIMVLVALWGLLEDGIFTKPPWQETMCQQLEEDYGRAFIHPYKDGEYIFAPEDSPDLLFFAYEDGDGYQTNYPERLVMDQIQQFAEKWGLPLEYDSAGEGYKGQLGETPGAYFLQMPLEGKGDAVTELGELLEAMKGQRWYRPRTPDFEVFLAYGDLHFYKSRSTEEEFDADYARVVYETKFGPELCRYIAEESGTAAIDLDGGYVLLERGTLEIDGTAFFWCTGMSKPPDSVPVTHYLLSADGRQLFSVPNQMMEAGFSLDQLYQGVRLIRTIPELGDHASLEIYNLSSVRGYQE